MRMELCDDNFDDTVDLEIAECLSLEKPVSFFMFAGAGSGKTRSLVKAINHVLTAKGGESRRYLALHSKYVGVITFTKAATNEILKRTKFDAAVRVSTIHNFAWELIKGFNEDIRRWLVTKLKDDIAKLEDEQSRARSATNKASIARAKRIESKSRRLQRLPSIRKFTYNPDSENSERDSLAHSEVVGVAAEFLSNNPLMQRLLVTRFPILLIDESQDTSARLMDSLLKVQEKHRDYFALGLFGDTMQRIYNDGKPDLDQNLPADWKKPVKQMNHRCPPRIVELINKVRSTDSKSQRARTDRGEGLVRLFLVETGSIDRMLIEKQVAEQMADITGDKKWTEQLGVKRLILEHHMASSRMGFTEMFKPLYDAEKLKTGLLDGTLSGIQFFARNLLPIMEGNELLITAAVRDHSPLLSRKELRQDEALRVEAISRCREAVVLISSAFGINENITFGEILRLVAATGLFSIPENLRFFVQRGEGDGEGGNVEEDSEEVTSRLLETQNAWEAFLAAPFSQMRPYLEYVSGKGGFDTHQGVKGLEFPRVMVIMDDGQARGWQFSYDGLFGAKGQPSSSKPKEDPDRTKRLLYVTCSRAEESLALIAYSEKPAVVQRNVIRDEWFADHEVVRL